MAVDQPAPGGPMMIWLNQIANPNPETNSTDNSGARKTVRKINIFSSKLFSSFDVELMHPPTDHVGFTALARRTMT